MNIKLLKNSLPESSISSSESAIPISRKIVVQPSRKAAAVAKSKANFYRVAEVDEEIEKEEEEASTIFSNKNNAKKKKVFMNYIYIFEYLLFLSERR